MSPSDSFVSAVNAALADPNVRASIRQMHAQDYPLVRMVEDLGLEDDMTTRIRQILEGLPANVVEDIRQATLKMLDGTDYQMPLNCMVTNQGLESGTPVVVDVESVDGRPTICVRPSFGATTSLTGWISVHRVELDDWPRSTGLTSGLPVPSKRK